MKYVRFLFLIACFLLTSGCQFAGVFSGNEAQPSSALPQKNALTETPSEPAGGSVLSPDSATAAATAASADVAEDLPSVISEQEPQDSANPDLSRFGRVQLPAELASADSQNAQRTPLLSLAWQQMGNLYFLQGSIKSGEGTGQVSALCHWDRGRQTVRTVLGPEVINPNCFQLFPAGTSGDYLSLINQPEDYSLSFELLDSNFQPKLQLAKYMTSMAPPLLRNDEAVQAAFNFVIDTENTETFSLSYLNFSELPSNGESAPTLHSYPYSGNLQILDDGGNRMQTFISQRERDASLLLYRNGEFQEFPLAQSYYRSFSIRDLVLLGSRNSEISASGETGILDSFDIFDPNEAKVIARFVAVEPIDSAMALNDYEWLTLSQHMGRQVLRLYDLSDINNVTVQKLGEVEGSGSLFRDDGAIALLSSDYGTPTANFSLVEVR